MILFMDGGFLPKGIAFHSPTFIYLFNYLFTSIWTHGCLSYALSYNPVVRYLVTQTVPASPGP